MDFTRFVSMLESGGLFFCRLDRLDDAFEGAISQPQHEALREQYSEVVMKAAAAFTQMSSRARIMVNCWHLSEHESAAMWVQYSRGGNAIGIQSTYARLRDCLRDRVKGIGLIQYIDFQHERMRDEHPFYSRFMHKRKSFEHEKELRAVIYNRDDDPAPVSVYIPVDLDALLTAVYVAPKSPDWYRKLVADVASRYGLRAPVERSSLDTDPIF